MKINHGANIFELAKKLNKKEDEILDFSSNITPFGLSPKAIEALRKNLNLASLYPDPNYTDLKKAIATYSFCNPENIILGSGATEIIATAIQCIKPQKALLLSPAYSEYEKELKKTNTRIFKFFYDEKNDFNLDIEELKNQIKKIDPDMIIICNPNNPTGQLISLNTIKEFLSFFKKTIMIDETYIEFTDFEKTSSFSLAKDFENLLAVRGTSKFFSTPGIRLGYAVCKGDLFEKITSTLPLWNINIFADIMGEKMFTDFEFISNSRKIFTKNFSILYNGLKEFKDFKIYPSKSNFILCKILSEKFSADDLYNYLLKFGIIIRKAESFEGLNNKFFRVCVLNEKDIYTLLEKIKNFIKNI